ncbi:hypothetical protein [Rickettsia tamurae]|uniref:hypothetical protein n=1 Tax=Rickettsia tamurae TaxID=334545 RepID=UPI001BFCDDCF|nr:hypothetical protein [Rickettsia tamurae]
MLNKERYRHCEQTLLRGSKNAFGVIPWLDHGMTPSVLYGPCVFLKFYIRFTEFL